MDISLIDNIFVTFDVIGVKYKLKRDVFDKYQESTFYEIINRGESSEKCALKNFQLPDCVTEISKNEFYILRCPDLFKLVLESCINGILHVPDNLCSDQVAKEFKFWNIKYENLCENLCENCASHHYHVETKVVEVEKSHFLIKDENCFQIARGIVWTFMEKPHSSKAATFFFYISVSIIIISICNIILASIPELQYCPLRNGTESDSDERKAQDEPDEFKHTDCKGTFVFNIIDIICMSWFSLELLLRLLSCSNYKQYVTSPVFFIDLLSVIPFYVELIIFLSHADAGDSDSLEKLKAMLVFLRIFKLLRIFQILKFARYTLSLKVLGKTLKSAKGDLGMLSIFILMALLIFSNFVYQVEKDVPQSLFVSIPATFWWCIVTLTTVGYGDMYPQTVLGKMVGGITCVCGVLLVAFPIAILVEKFTTCYKEEKENQRKKRYNSSSSTRSRHHSFVSPRKEDKNSEDKKFLTKNYKI